MEENKEDLGQLFRDTIRAYTELDTEDKCEVLIKSTKELAAFIEILAARQGIELQYLQSREVLDLKKEKVSTDDYIEAMMVYIENIKHLLAQLVEPYGNDSEEEE